MKCKQRPHCHFYRTHCDNFDKRQFRFLIESFCEGSLHIKCRRLQYEEQFGLDAPEDLLPNGYLSGTHKKLRAENTRKFKRFKVKDGICLIQNLKTARIFTARVVDVSEGGMRLRLYDDTVKFGWCHQDSPLKILDHSLQGIPVSLKSEFMKPVWDKNEYIGCAFTDLSGQYLSVC